MGGKSVNVTSLDQCGFHIYTLKNHTVFQFVIKSNVVYFTLQYVRVIAGFKSFKATSPNTKSHHTAAVPLITQRLHFSPQSMVKAPAFVGTI